MSKQEKPGNSQLIKKEYEGRLKGHDITIKYLRESSLAAEKMGDGHTVTGDTLFLIDVSKTPLMYLDENKHPMTEQHILVTEFATDRPEELSWWRSERILECSPVINNLLTAFYPKVGDNAEIYRRDPGTGFSVSWAEIDEPNEILNIGSLGTNSWGHQISRGKYHIHQKHRLYLPLGYEKLRIERIGEQLIQKSIPLEKLHGKSVIMATDGIRFSGNMMINLNIPDEKLLEGPSGMYAVIKF